MEKVLFLLMAFMSLAVAADCQNRVTVHPDGRIEYDGEAAATASPNWGNRKSSITVRSMLCISTSSKLPPIPSPGRYTK